MDKSNPRRSLILKLAKQELAHCPAVLERLCAEFQSNSPVAQRMIDSIHPGMIPLAQHPEATGVSMNTIETGARGKIGAWARGQPDFQEVVQLPAPGVGHVQSTPPNTPFAQPPAITEPTPSTKTASDTDAKFTQLAAYIAAATGPGPVVRKKSPVVFVTDRRQPKPSPPAGNQGQESADQGKKQPNAPKSITNSTILKKKHHLSASIEKAQEGLTDPLNTTSVWANMQGLAERKYSNLLGATEDGIQYLKNGVAANFTRDALNKHLHPDKRGTPGKRRAPPA